ncbi:peptidoglycan DD-metalloendopeptidase family protein [Alkalilimnicola sp. S0819]|uniref:peptidoglycan DD-metalloendopeptidase family protein n=1 Tax=Alkalilimnicola sp. S0819 TaxID=2613922 RepID=UPI0012628AB3|nr:peptidoglycan DD-metalloendopeptidase family protein [Alkalilimnicola sp. S0819]KAB7627946.1 peptidoglycan DD-metalloendopeptidase family protein [Alkalilimnicola sp. S0819]MPQ15587.1 peptidoglycan DD-metalloendopeptidase family protein [Alkalilimnicola sp. S0819]
MVDGSAIGRGRLVAALALLLLGAALLLSGCASNHRAPVYTRGEQSIPASGIYQVRRGDTLYSISFRHGLDYRRVAAWNRIGAPYRIYPGQKIRLRPASTKRASKPPVARSPKPAPKSRTPAPSRPASTAQKWRWPTEGKVVRGFSRNANGKQGIEIRGRLGQAIEAAAPGRVVYSGNGLRGYGNLVIIKHDSRYLTAYGYNRRILVQEGESVSRGQRIAEMGAGSDRQPTLHFELRVDGKPVDPLRYLPGR